MGNVDIVVSAILIVGSFMFMVVGVPVYFIWYQGSTLQMRIHIRRLQRRLKRLKKGKSKFVNTVPYERYRCADLLTYYNSAEEELENTLRESIIKLTTKRIEALK